MANFANGHGNRATPDYETCHDRFPLSKSPSPRSPPFYFRDECANAKVASENSVIEPITLPKALVVIWERRYCEGVAGSSGDGYLVGLVEQDLINEGTPPFYPLDETTSHSTRLQKTAAKSLVNPGSPCKGEGEKRQHLSSYIVAFD